MFKLLPAQAKKSIRHEYHMRRFAVLVLAFAFAFFAGVIGLLPAYVISESKYEEAALAADIVERSTALKDNQALSAEANDVRKELSLLSLVTPVMPYEIFQNAALLRTPGISIGTLEWSMKNSESFLVLTGVADDRKALLDFQNTLNTSGKFKASDLPLSQLAKDKDIDFTFTLSVLDNDK